MGALRSPHDRTIVGLAVPALGALAAEPAYLLVDTAIVGHLGTRELAALALAATVLGVVVALCNFLAYGMTGRVARLHGAGEHARAAELAAQGLWLATGLGIVVAAAVVALADPLVAVLGGTGATADLAARYLRISALGLPMALIALAGQGHLRGTGDLRTPLVILVVANAVNAVLEVVLVYGFDTGLDGSAIGTVIAQLGMGAAFAALLLRPGRVHAASRRPDPVVLRGLLRVGGEIAVRTAALLGSFVLASAVVARSGEASLAAHQIGFQLFLFLAFVLDALAIAGQILVGRHLGSGDVGTATAVARRLVVLSLALGAVIAALLIAGTSIVPRAFTSDPAVLDEAAALWPLLAVLLPVGAMAFALDGILIGAGDTRYLAVAMVVSFLVFAPLALVSLAVDGGVVGVWASLALLMVARLATTGHRFRGGRWAVVGASR